MRIATALLALALLASLAAAATYRMRAQDADERVAVLERDVAALRESLADETAARARLEAEADSLRDARSAARDDTAPDLVVAAPGASAEPEVAAEVPATDPARAPEQAQFPAGLPGFDADRLVEAGFRRDDVERFRARVDEIQLAQLDLRDRATRENWLGTPRFHQESRALQESIGALRGEFGDELYDWVLFTNGQPNRVAIAEVMTGSAGESAGLARGDVILRYDDGVMFDPIQLRDATMLGRAGELVAVEVYRQSENATLRFFVRRGPIGVRLTTALMEPPPPG